MRFFSLPLLALVALPVLANDLPVTVDRLAPPAKVVRAGKAAPLTLKTKLLAGDRVVAGAKGRVALRVADAAVLGLGDDSELLLHSAVARGGAQGEPLLRLVLPRGALQVDAAGADLRVNLGNVKLRAAGSEIWVAAEPRGETVCLLEGEQVEIAGEFGLEKITTEGECLLFSASNRRLLLKPTPGETLNRKLLRTAFADNAPAITPDVPVAYSADSNYMPPPETTALPDHLPPALATPVSLLHEPPADAPAPAPVAMPAPVVLLPAPVAAPAAEAVSSGDWSVVAASVTTAEGAQRYAESLQKQGLPAVAQSVGGKHRVVVGRFATRAEALALRETMQRDGAYIGAWITQF